jgi:hypothetical protein
VHPRRNEEVARALRRRAGEHRRLDLEEAAVVQNAPHAEGDLVAQDEVLEHGRPAQIEEAVLEPQLLRRVRPVLDRERWRLGPREERETRSDDLDLARRQIGVPLALAPEDDRALDLDDVLAAGAGRGVDGLAGAARAVEHDLDDTGAVADVEEDELAEVPAPGDPALEQDRTSRVGSAQLARRLARRLRGRAHRSLAAPSSSPSAAFAKLLWAPVARFFTVTVSPCRSSAPSSTARTLDARNP